MTNENIKPLRRTVIVTIWFAPYMYRMYSIVSVYTKIYQYLKSGVYGRKLVILDCRVGETRNCSTITSNFAIITGQVEHVQKGMCKNSVK